LTTSIAAVQPRVTIERWPSERPLFVASLLVAAAVWVVLLVTVIGAVYAVLFLGFIFLGHVAFMAHVRGSAVRVGPDQLPELHAAVTRIAERIGLEPVPAVYLMQADGALNALATRFFGSHSVVLFADLLDACGSDEAARDMIIAHELGHVHAGHLRWMWLLAPSRLVPFLGSALSRAREFTCDRYGLAGAGNRESALLGLTILAAGGAQARRVNRALLVRQEADLQTGWLTLGTWLSSHPPISRRLAAIDPALEAERPAARPGPGRALFLLFGLSVLLAVGTVVAVGAMATLAEEGEPGVVTPGESVEYPPSGVAP
jgi:Zn-dependent protease with chaperone function